MEMRKTILFSFILMIVACSAPETETTAHITQRKLRAGGKLLISYQFREGNKLFYDSVEVNNRVIPHDSVKVAYPALRPGSSHLLLP